MSASQAATLAVLALTLAALVREWLPVGLVGVLAPLALVVLRVIPARLMWGGLADPAVVAVAGMFVVSAALSRTGALEFLGDSLARLGRQGDRRILLAMMLTVAALSAFINNTTVVLVSLPVVLRLCERLRRAPSRYLIPLSFASIFGGMVTLVGTSTNIIVATAGEEALEAAGRGHTFHPGMWHFAPMGLIFLLAGSLYMLTAGRALLPRKRGLTVPLAKGLPTEYVTEVEVLNSFPLLGRPLGDLEKRYEGLRILQVIRQDVTLPPRPDTLLLSGDVLLVKGAPDSIVSFGGGGGTALLPGVGPRTFRARQLNATLAEVIVPPGSRWIGRAVHQIGFRDRYGVSVIAVQRHGQHIRQKVRELVVEPADIILLQGSVQSLRRLRISDNLILVEGVSREVKLRSRAPLALSGLLLFVLSISLGWLDLATGAVAGATYMVVSRCMTLQEAYEAVDWNILFILAGSLVLGRAAHHVGLDAQAATALQGLMGGGSPFLLVAVIYGLTAFLTDLISNGAAAALMIPVVVQLAWRFQVSPGPLLMTVAFGASCAFLTPVGYQTNLLVYAPGGYRASDFFKVGLPLRLLFWLLSILFIPLFYPF